MRSVHHGLDAATSEEELLELVGALGEDDEVDGILVQLPLPDQIDPDAVVAAIDPAQGRRRPDPGQRRPARPRHAGPGALHAGRGDGAAAPTRGSSWRAPRRSSSAARSWSGCRSRACCWRPTRPSPSATRAPATSTPICRRADVLVAAVGVPRLLGAEAVKPGAVVIDVGMNRTEDGLVGDVDFEAAAEVAAAITPVPGGVGPMTIAMLLVNTLQAARLARRQPA